MAKKVLGKLTVQWNESVKLWTISAGGVLIDYAWTKLSAVGYARAIASKRYGTFDLPTSITIRLKNGQIDEERTYPRAADPRKSKG